MLTGAFEFGCWQFILRIPLGLLPWYCLSICTKRRPVYYALGAADEIPLADQIQRSWFVGLFGAVTGAQASVR
jgi:hypothetical protein